MCGISAIFRFEGVAGADLADLGRMHRAQRHRGPDGEGVLVIDRHLQGRRYERLPASGSERGDLRLVAAVRRLRISDLSALADLPVVSADWRRWVMLNGAIYNFRELAAELSAAGHRFQTGSNTEVVLQAYRQWGTSCFARFNGMWAILKHYLPARVVASKEKRRFVLMNNWMPLREKHAGALKDASRSMASTKLAYVDAVKLRNFVDDYLAGRHKDAYAVWRIYTASRWLDLFGL